MAKKDYSKLEKDDLLKVIEKLESRKKYGLIWDEEKTKEQFEKESENALPVLKEVKGKEIKTDPKKPTNILIEGDNYHALSVLNYTHQGKIDVIYIDPPYNTGNKDFKYNDNYVDKEDAYRHSKWLSFMGKRLRLAKNLLKDTGVIFISIDEHELAQLKLISDEIFVEKNLVAIFTWVRKRKPSHLDTHVRKNTEFLVCYAKNIDSLKPLKSSSAEDDKPYPFYNSGNTRGILEFPKNYIKVSGLADGVYEPKEYLDKKTKVKLLDRVKIVNGVVANSFKLEGEWRYSQNSLNELVASNEEIVLKGKKFKPYYIRKLTGHVDELKNTMTIFGSTGKIKKIDDPDFYEAELKIGTNEDAEQELSNMGIKFSNPKPISLIEFIVKIATVYAENNAIILDFFAGSGTTAHAMLRLNSSYQFILSTNNEENICTDICYPRIQKAIKGYKTPKEEKIDGLGGNLKYFKTAFVKNSISRDDLKMRITRECTEMLCLREGIFDEVKAKPDYHIFEQNGRVMGVYYALEREGLQGLKKELDKMKGEKILYCFTLDPLGLDKEDFADWQGVSLEPIPQKILDIYEQIYEY